MCSHDSHHQHRNGVVGKPPAGASLPSSLLEDECRSPATASPPSRARDEDAAQLAPPAPKKRRVCSHQFCFVRKRVRPWGGGFPQTLVSELLAKCSSYAVVSSFQTVECIMHIEMRGGRFAVMNQANQRLPSLDVSLLKLTWSFTPGRGLLLLIVLYLLNH